MIIQHNMSADYTNRMHYENEERKADLSTQLSSGYRLTNTKVDASGSTISQGMRGRIRGLEQAGENAQNGMFLLDVAEGAAAQIHGMLQRVRELSVEAANDTNVDEDREAMNEEATMLTDEMDRIAMETEYNTKKLLDGSLALTGHELKIQVGANSEQYVDILIDSLRTTAIGMNGVDLSDHDKADEWITKTDDAIGKVAALRSVIGATTNRLMASMKVANTMAEYLQDTESRIADTDMASTMVDYAKESILGNSINAMMVQANNMPRGVLSLLKTEAGGTTSVSKAPASDGSTTMKAS